MFRLIGWLVGSPWLVGPPFFFLLSLAILHQSANTTMERLCSINGKSQRNSWLPHFMHLSFMRSEKKKSTWFPPFRCSDMFQLFRSFFFFFIYVFVIRCSTDHALIKDHCSHVFRAFTFFSVSVSVSLSPRYFVILSSIVQIIRARVCLCVCKLRCHIGVSAIVLTM